MNPDLFLHFLTQCSHKDYCFVTFRFLGVVAELNEDKVGPGGAGKGSISSPWILPLGLVSLYLMNTEVSLRIDPHAVGLHRIRAGLAEMKKNIIQSVSEIGLLLFSPAGPCGGCSGDFLVGARLR